MRFSLNLLTVFGALALFALSAASAQAQTIRLITLADTTSFAEAAPNDVKMIETFFQKNAGPAKMKYEHVKLSTDGATAKGVLKEIAKTPCEENDLLVFYYSGHGAQDGEKGHYFPLNLKENPKENDKPDYLFRSDVVDALKAKRARLVFFFTDCCNVLSATRSGDVGKSAPPNVGRCAAFNALFVQPSGVLDLTSSKYGEFSFTDGKIGSIATMALIDAFNALDQRAKDNPDADITWRDAVQLLYDKSNVRFKAKFPKGVQSDVGKGQKTQIPHVYEWPGVPRFGVRAQSYGDANLVVTEVVAGSPGARVLKKGDVLLKINGEDAIDQTTFARLIDESPENATIEFKRDGQKHTVEVKLNGTNVEAPIEPNASASEPESSGGSATVDPPQTTAQNDAQRRESNNRNENQNNQSSLASLDPGVYSNRTQNNNNNNNSDQNDDTQNNGSQNAGTQSAERSSYVFGAQVNGNKIVAIAPGSPAEDAGLEAGDVIVSFNGVRIHTAQNFSDAVDGAPIDVKLVVNKKNGENNLELSVRLNKTYVFGAQVENAKIIAIVPGSPAEEAGLAVGDVIVSFGGRRILTSSDFSAAVDAASRETQVVVSSGNGQRRTVNVTLNK